MIVGRGDAVWPLLPRALEPPPFTCENASCVRLMARRSSRGDRIRIANPFLLGALSSTPTSRAASGATVFLCFFFFFFFFVVVSVRFICSVAVASSMSFFIRLNSSLHIVPSGDRSSHSTSRGRGETHSSSSSPTSSYSSSSSASSASYFLVLRGLTLDAASVPALVERLRVVIVLEAGVKLLTLPLERATLGERLAEDTKLLAVAGLKIGLSLSSSLSQTMSPVPLDFATTRCDTAPPVPLLRDDDRGSAIRNLLARSVGATAASAVPLLEATDAAPVTPSFFVERRLDDIGCNY